MSNFPDYEAARKVIRTWFDGAFAGDHVVADNIINAALRDEPLYRVDKTHERKRTTDPVKYVQVWPKEKM